MPLGVVATIDAHKSASGNLWANDTMRGYPAF